MEGVLPGAIPHSTEAPADQSPDEFPANDPSIDADTTAPMDASPTVLG